MSSTAYISLTAVHCVHCALRRAFREILQLYLYLGGTRRPAWQVKVNGHFLHPLLRSRSLMIENERVGVGRCQLSKGGALCSFGHRILLLIAYWMKWHHTSQQGLGKVLQQEEERQTWSSAGNIPFLHAILQVSITWLPITWFSCISSLQPAEWLVTKDNRQLEV